MPQSESRFTVEYDGRYAPYWKLWPGGQTNEWFCAHRAADGAHLSRHQNGRLHIRTNLGPTTAPLYLPIVQLPIRSSAHLVATVLRPTSICTGTNLRSGVISLGLAGPTNWMRFAFVHEESGFDPAVPPHGHAPGIRFVTSLALTSTCGVTVLADELVDFTPAPMTVTTNVVGSGTDPAGFCAVATQWGIEIVEGVLQTAQGNIGGAGTQSTR